MRNLLCSTVAALTLLAFTGCGNKPGQADKITTHDDMLADLKRMLEEYATTKKGAPKKLADIEPLEPSYPAAFHALSTGKCVYVWGASLSGGTAVIAYKKETPTEGGPVLLQDGTVKQMTAEEFAAAPKAK